MSGDGPSLTTIVKEQTQAVKEQIKILNDVLKEIAGLTQQYREISQNVQGQNTVRYKYQDAIDFLMQQGKVEGPLASTSGTTGSTTIQDKKCLTPEEVIQILQGSVSSAQQHQCLTKKELLSFFPQRQRIPQSVKLPPPETKT